MLAQLVSARQYRLARLQYVAGGVYVAVDAIHKVTRTLVRNQVICVESLNITGMTQDRHLANAISNAGWGEFVRQFTYKAEWAGRQVVKVSQWFPSSKVCHGCGHRVETLPLSQRHWHCDGCGEPIDRDINAAKNIQTTGLAGLAIGAKGVGQRPSESVPKHEGCGGDSGTLAQRVGSVRQRIIFETLGDTV
ncbi:RNA-guided endonuclease InsQ/TnpB family protein [Vreelandella andesensis]|uniref:RNA-guided endonuclease InsQ/TnpB family protein n=1 Tax=Vreelandella andesensis TaxID=447567 RepID=UPI001FC977E6|nr:transposase [Halomonas andesensis]